jgi:2-oxo-3-hexenedioate decarboxylase
MPLSEKDLEPVAARILAAADATRSIPPISDEIPGFDLADAYRVSNAVVRARIARGERALGWKIGFTNETIWDEYGVHAPIWGPMYDTTAGADVDGTLAVGMLVEPRIEPEIAFRIGRTPDPAMDEGALLECVDAVAHGFEIVQSLFPAWRFKAADTVAAFALHGRYRHGPFVTIAPAEREAWRAALSDFAVVLSRGEEEIDRGVARNVLGGGPLTALRHFVRGHAEVASDLRIRPGDIVTTGTVTRAFPVKPGETWSTRLEGLPLRGMNLALT